MGGVVWRQPVLRASPGTPLVELNDVMGGHVFAYEVANPSDYGVVEFDESGRVLSIAEKQSLPAATTRCRVCTSMTRPLWTSPNRSRPAHGGVRDHASTTTTSRRILLSLSWSEEPHGLTPARFERCRMRVNLCGSWKTAQERRSGASKKSHGGKDGYPTLNLMPWLSHSPRVVTGTTCCDYWVTSSPGALPQSQLLRTRRTARYRADA